MQNKSAHFFNGKLETTGKPRIEAFHFFSMVGEKVLLEKATRLIVPDEAIDQAHKMVTDHHFTFPAVKMSDAI